MAKRYELSINEYIAYAQESWKERLLNCIHEDEDRLETDERLQELFQSLVNSIKEILISEDGEALKYVQEKFGGESTVYNELIKYVKEFLAPYYSFSSLRKQESEYPDSIHKMIDLIFEELIVRFNPEFSSLYKKAGFKKEEDFIDAAVAISSLTDFVIKKNYTRNTIEDIFQEISRLNDKTTAYIADKINDNFSELRMVYILEALAGDEAE